MRWRLVGNVLGEFMSTARDEEHEQRSLITALLRAGWATRVVPPLHSLRQPSGGIILQMPYGSAWFWMLRAAGGAASTSRASSRASSAVRHATSSVRWPTRLRPVDVLDWVTPLLRRWMEGRRLLEGDLQAPDYGARILQRLLKLALFLVRRLRRPRPCPNVIKQ